MVGISAAVWPWIEAFQRRLNLREKSMHSQNRHELARWVGLLMVAWTLGVLLAPHCYNASQALVDLAINKQTNALLHGICVHLDHWRLSDFLICSEWLSLIALVLIGLSWLQSGGSAARGWQGGAHDWVGVMQKGQALRPNPMMIGHVIVGMSLAGAMILIWFIVAMQTMPLVWHEMALHPQGWPGLLAMIVGVVISEVLLRGVLLGVLLRHMRPMLAIVLVAVLGALPHAGFYHIAEQRVLACAWWSGFEWHGRQLQQVLEIGSLPVHATLLLAGVLLGWLRYRGASLALPIGLRLGWALGLAMLATMTRDTELLVPVPMMLIMNPILQVTAVLLFVVLALLVKGVQGGSVGTSELRSA